MLNVSNLNVVVVGGLRPMTCHILPTYSICNDTVTFTISSKSFGQLFFIVFIHIKLSHGGQGLSILFPHSDVFYYMCYYK